WCDPFQFEVPIRIHQRRRGFPDSGGSVGHLVVFHHKRLIFLLCVVETFSQTGSCTVGENLHVVLQDIQHNSLDGRIDWRLVQIELLDELTCGMIGVVQHTSVIAFNIMPKVDELTLIQRLQHMVERYHIEDVLSQQPELTPTAHEEHIVHPDLTFENRDGQCVLETHVCQPIFVFGSTPVNGQRDRWDLSEHQRLSQRFDVFIEHLLCDFDTALQRHQSHSTSTPFIYLYSI